MADYLFYALLGTGAAAIIAALAVGLVVTYQGSGVVNLALGATTTWTAFTFAELRRGRHLSGVGCGEPGSWCHHDVDGVHVRRVASWSSPIRGRVW